MTQVTKDQIRDALNYFKGQQSAWSGHNKSTIYDTAVSVLQSALDERGDDRSEKIRRYAIAYVDELLKSFPEPQHEYSFQNVCRARLEGVKTALTQPSTGVGE